MLAALFARTSFKDTQNQRWTNCQSWWRSTTLCSAWPVNCWHTWSPNTSTGHRTGDPPGTLGTSKYIIVLGWKSDLETPSKLSPILLWASNMRYANYKRQTFRSSLIFISQDHDMPQGNCSKFTSRPRKVLVSQSCSQAQKVDHHFEKTLTTLIWLSRPATIMS